MITFINLLILFIIISIFLIPATNKKRLNNISLLASISKDFNNLPFLLPLIILWLSLEISLIYKFNSFVEILFFIITTIIIYEKFYYENEIKKSLLSFLAFFCNTFLFFFYIFSFKWINIGLPKPIFMEDLNNISYYRYIIFLIFFIIGLLVYYKYNNFYNKLTFPYLKEEIRKIMDLKKIMIFGPLCTLILKKCKNKKFLFLSLFLHFFLFVFFRLFILTLFINFCFFNGDFRYIMYLTPLLFISWILSFFEYYFEIFFENSKVFLNSLILVTPIKELNKPLQNTILTTGDDFSFSLTAFALQEGYNRVDILANIWLDFGHFDFFFKEYKKYIRYINIGILTFYISCWISLSYYFLTKNFIVFFHAVHPVLSRCSIFPNFITRGMFRATAPLNASEAYGVRQIFQAALEAETGGSFKKNHLVLADKSIRNPDNSLEIKYEGTLTSGTGSITNPSFPLHPSKNVTGENKPQNFVPPRRNPEYIKENYLNSNPVNNSQAFMEEPVVKTNHSKNMPLREET